jgi:hypothetical protein
MNAGLTSKFLIRKPPSWLRGSGREAEPSECLFPFHALHFSFSNIFHNVCAIINARVENLLALSRVIEDMGQYAMPRRGRLGACHLGSSCLVASPLLKVIVVSDCNTPPSCDSLQQRPINVTTAST